MERTAAEAAAGGKGAWRDGAVTYLHLLFYIAISGGQIFFNKASHQSNPSLSRHHPLPSSLPPRFSGGFCLRVRVIRRRRARLYGAAGGGFSVAARFCFWCCTWVLSSKEINFPYPVALTLLHMVFSSVVCFAITKIFKIVKIEEGMTTDIYISSVIPIGAMFAMTLWLGNSAYLYISVAFAQMLKAIMPVAVFLLGAAFGLEEMSCKMLAIMSVISVGVIVASVGEITISWVGVVYQMGGVVAEALRLIFIEIFLKKKGVRLNLISMITSALTARVTGVVRDWSVVLLSAAIFADTQLTFINIIGYAIAIAGVVAYNNHKLKPKPQGNEQQSADSKANPGSPQDVETSISTKEAS
uniref:Sugar phosphate transporter domain-containing protein n=1 Tax=Oryza meridionalis TaxID=40149 RepID=A0A0E0EHK4_9ORYZ